MARNFMELLKAKWTEGKFICVGLDTELKMIRHPVGEFSGNITSEMLGFNKWIVNQTHDLVCAYKPNLKFYLRYGSEGIAALEQTMQYIRETAPTVPVILDAKDMDIGNTNNGSVCFAFDRLGADAITVNPYLGREAAQPFLDCKDKGVIVLCRTSNPGAGEFQNLDVDVTEEAFNEIKQMQPADIGHFSMSRYIPLYQYLAWQVRNPRSWNKNGNCCLVVGATAPEELAQVRVIVGDMPLLIPGIGAQGGDVEKTVLAGKDSRDQGMIINSSRGIIGAEDPRFETLKVDQLVRQCLSPA